MVHRNFKSANILLDDETIPHLSDCGIAALIPIDGEQQVSINIFCSGSMHVQSLCVLNKRIM
jgi:serine/threonine protein kinase